MTGGDVEWRVQWRRASWSPGSHIKSRRFARRDDLDRFLARLARRGRSPLSLVAITWRHVGPWQDDRPVARCGRPTAAGPPCRTIVAEPGESCQWHRPGAP